MHHASVASRRQIDQSNKKRGFRPQTLRQLRSFLTQEKQFRHKQEHGAERCSLFDALLQDSFLLSIIRYSNEGTGVGQIVHAGRRLSRNRPNLALVSASIELLLLLHLGKMMRRNGIMELLIIFCALLIRTSSTTYQSSNFSKIIYLSFERNITSERVPVKAEKPLDATHADDTPYSLVKLKFAFNFFGNNIYNIFVNPNGALHQSKVPSTVQGPFPTALNTTYHGIIAGYLADLNPAIALKTANITSFVNDSMVSIRYQAVPIFEKKNELTVSFRISLFKDSRIVIDYDNIVSFPNWISGIRVPLYNNFSDVSREQKKVGRTEWNTVVSGVYPNISNAKTGHQFIACPMSKVWGARLNLAPATKTVLTLSPFLSSCHQYLDIAIALKEKGVAQQQFASCTFQTGVLNPPLSCDLSKVVITGAAVGNIFWKVKGPSAPAYKPMAVQEIPLDFSTPPSAVDRYSMSSDLALGCTAESLYLRDYSCLKLPCDTVGNKTIPVLYKNPICFGKTPDHFLDKCATNLAYDMVGSHCCTIAEMDCAGLCYGKTQVGLTLKTNGTMECCVQKVVDCLGYCGGTAIRDACGTCQGKNFKGTGCNTSVVLNTTTGPEKLFAKIDYSDPHKLWSIKHINITNKNSASVIFNISNSLNNAALGPHIGLSTIPYFILGPKEAKTIVVNISSIALYNAHQTDWEVKTLQFFYWVNPKNTTADRKYFKVQILTGAGNCDAISNVGSCMRVPACILCASYPTLRVLREVTETAEGEEQEEELIGMSGEKEQDEEEDESGLEQWKGEGGPDEWKYYYRRRLFTGLIPMALGTQVDPPLSGLCLNGFASSVCPLTQLSGGPEPRTYTCALIAVTALASLVLALR
jgi:hypothetical protein